MSFDFHSLNRLRKLGRELPKELPIPKEVSKNKETSSNKKHIIESEENPEALFHELMKVSPDGNIPTHLIARLKEAEAKQLDQKHVTPSSQSNSISKSKNIPSKKEININKYNGDESLYVSFERLLLEEDD